MARMYKLHSMAQCAITLLLILQIGSAAPAQHILNNADKDLHKILKFDEIPTFHGSGNLSHYSHLTFTSFKLVNASSAPSNGLISIKDSDCAASSPNTLVASRHENPSHWPRMVLEPASAASANISRFFNFVGLNRKPMNYTPQYTSIFINAYGIVDKKLLTHYSLRSTYLREGYQPSYPVNITQFFPGWGRNVNMVEIYAETPAGKDWDFCIDDVMVEFQEREDKEDLKEHVAPARMHVSIDIV